jgi:hypothetical protein
MVNNWSKGPVVWEDEQYEYISIVFSWDWWKFTKRAQPGLSGKKIIVGGPAVYLNPEWAPKWVEIQKKPPDVQECSYSHSLL